MATNTQMSTELTRLRATNNQLEDRIEALLAVTLEYLVLQQSPCTCDGTQVCALHRLYAQISPLITWSSPLGRAFTRLERDNPYYTPPGDDP
jgi:hypothetical protein